MAITFHSGFEGGNTFEWPNVTGVVSVQQAIKFTGSYAMRCNTVGASAYVNPGIAYARRVTFRLYIAVAPGAPLTIIGRPTTTDTKVKLTSDRYLQLFSGLSNMGQSTTQLLLNTWYRVSVSRTDVDARVFINGFLEISGGTRWSIIPDFGNIDSGTADLYFDDYAQDLTDGQDLGDIRTLVSLPNAAGQYADFDTVVPAGVHYTTYDDPPGSINDGDYVQQAGKTQVRDTANLQDCSDIGIVAGDTLQAVNVLARMKGDVTAGITVRDNGSDYDYVKAVNKATAWFSQYFDVMPKDSAVWAIGRFDAFQAGGLSTGTSTDTFLYALMVMVAYTPLIGLPSIDKISGVSQATVDKINGVAMTNIAKINGIA